MGTVRANRVAVRPPIVAAECRPPPDVGVIFVWSKSRPGRSGMTLRLYPRPQGVPKAAATGSKLGRYRLRSESGGYSQFPVEFIVPRSE